MSIRRWASVALVFLSVLLVLASTVAVWTYRTALNPDRFTDTVRPALDEPELYEAISDVVSTQTLAALDLETRVEVRLTQADEYISEALPEVLDVDALGQRQLSQFDRPSLEALTPVVTSALEDRVHQIIDRLITSDQFRQRLPELVSRAHRAAVALLRGETEEFPNVYTAGGEVRLNLVPIIAEALRSVVAEFRDFLPDVELPDAVSAAATTGREQLADALGEHLPADFGQVTLMSEDALGQAQAALDRLDRYMWMILLITAAVVALTVAITPTRRRTIVQLGVGIILGLILGAVAIRRLRHAVLAEIESPQGERAAAVLLNETINSLRTAAVIVGVVAFLAGIAAYLVGRPTWAGRASGLDRWLGAHYDFARAAGVVAAVVIVFIVGFELAPLIIVGALLALYLWLLRHLTNSRSSTPQDHPTPS
jgi:hypothetical protein